MGHHKRKRGVAPMAAVVPNGVSLLEHSTHLLGPVTQLLIWKMGFFFLNLDLIVKANRRSLFSASKVRNSFTVQLRDQCSSPVS